MFEVIVVSYSTLKTKILADDLIWYYIDEDAAVTPSKRKARYAIGTINPETNEFLCAYVAKTTPANSDQSDFETNYKSGATILGVLADFNDKFIDTKHDFKINPDGSINVIPAPPSAPANTTPVVQEAFSDMADTTGVDTIYTITNGKSLTIQLLQASAEAEGGGTIVELFEDPNGNLSMLNRIAVLIVDGASNDKLIDEDYVGDGTRRIVMRRRTYTGSAREVEGRWIGYEV